MSYFSTSAGMAHGGLPGLGTLFAISEREIDLTIHNEAPTRAGMISIHAGLLKFSNGTVAHTVASVASDTDIVSLTGAGAPTDGAAGTGAGVAGTGSQYIRTSNGATYCNTNTKASPTWTLEAAAGALTDGKIWIGSAANAATEQTLTGDVTVTSAGVTAVGTAKITSAMMTEVVIKYATVTLTNAQILNLRATPITMVAAPGANKSIQFLGATLNLGASAGAYTETADNLVFRLVDGTGIIQSQTVEMTGFIDQAAKMHTRAVPTLDPIMTEAQAVNTALVLHNSGDGEFGGGDAANTMKVTIAYRVVGTL